MPRIVEEQRELYAGVWQIPNYAEFAPGEVYAKLFADMAKNSMRGSVLDAGCGSGKGALALGRLGYNVIMCDLTDEGLVDEAKGIPFYPVCLWDDVKRVVGFRDWVYCCDVLEHIPTEYTMLVVHRLLQVARRGVFLSIALQPDIFGLWTGKPLHLTVQSFTWWRDRLKELGQVRECRDLIVSGLYLLEPR